MLLEFGSEFPFLMFFAFEDTSIVRFIEGTLTSKRIAEIDSTGHVRIIMGRISTFVDMGASFGICVGMISISSRISCRHVAKFRRTVVIV